LAASTVRATWRGEPFCGGSDSAHSSFGVP
jgi:hypothetical protein